MKITTFRELIKAGLLSSALFACPVISHADGGATPFAETYNSHSPSMPVIRAGDTSLLSSTDPTEYVSTIAPANNAGLLNYCVENNYVDPDTGMKDLLAYNKKVNAVFDDERGNIPYAQGSSGELHATNGQVYNVALSTLPVRHNACKAIYQRVQTALGSKSAGRDSTAS